MEANTWHIISIIGYSLAAVLFVWAIMMFFMMNIFSIIGDLTGRTAAKQIREIRERNSLTGNKRHQPDAFNLERGTLTERVGRPVKIGKTAQAIAHASKRLDDQAEETSRPMFIYDEKTDGFVLVLTSDVEAASLDATEVLGSGNDSGQLAKGTKVLNFENFSGHQREETEVLNTCSSSGQEAEGTEVLEDCTQRLEAEEGTKVLSDHDGLTVPYPTAELGEEQHIPVKFKIVKDIIVIHTTEKI